MWPNVELTGAARLYRAASSARRERGRAQGYAAWVRSTNVCDFGDSSVLELELGATREV